MHESNYSRHVDTVRNSIWRNLRTTELNRAPKRDFEIASIDHVVVEGNFMWNLIKVETTTGEYGLGESFSGPIGEYINLLEPALAGQNPLDVDRLTEDMTQLLSPQSGQTGYSQAAISGIETALWDLTGKLTDLPVYQLLGGKYRDEVPVYVDCHAGEAFAGATEAESPEIYAPDAYATVAQRVVDEGFSALKFDLDVRTEDVDTAPRRLSNREIQHKVDIVRAVREQIGSEPMLGFDLHWCFTAETAIRLAKEIEDENLAWLEDPVPPENPAVHKKVTDSTRIPILSGENLTRVEGFLPFMTDQSIDIIAPDVQKCGGLLETRKIATLAEAYGIPMAPHNISSPVGTIASVHLCAATPNAFTLEWHSREVDWWDEFYEGPDLIQDGSITVPEEPGLGLTIDEEVVSAHLAEGEEMFDIP